MVAADITAEICEDLADREMTETFVDRIFTNFAAALGVQESST